MTETWTEGAFPYLEPVPSLPPWVLVLAWILDEPDRVGESAVLAARGPAEGVWGRGTAHHQLRPGVARPTGALTSPRLSRELIRWRVEGADLQVAPTGKAPLSVGSQRIEGWTTVQPGAVLAVPGRALLVVERPDLPDAAGATFPFGRADADGLVGESEAMALVRLHLDRLAPHRAHLLIVGPSGSGKERCARGIHRRSLRPGPLVSRNAATLPPGLVDAELFGNVRNYPHHGLPERPGLVGAADRGTLFLDEIGDLPEAVQPHLLRVLDDGEHQPLGDHRVRRVDLRVIGATHRPLEQLRPDVLARFPLRLVLPGLEARRSDVALIAAERVRRLAEDEGEPFRSMVQNGRVKLPFDGVYALLLRPYRTHVRELEQALWALALGQGVPGAPAPEAGATAVDWRAWVGQPPERLPPDVLESALAEHHGRLEATAAALGLSSRFVLHRLLKRHQIATVRRREGATPDRDRSDA